MLSIGEVLGLLRPEFPDVSISKLRFPRGGGAGRAAGGRPSGYRKYTGAHVERLRFVLLAPAGPVPPTTGDPGADRGDGPWRAGDRPGPDARARHPHPPPRASVRGPPRSRPLSSHRGSFRRERVVTPRTRSARRRAAAAGTRDPRPRGELGDARLTRAELADRSGLDEAALVDLEQYGLLVPGSNGYYGTEGVDGGPDRGPAGRVSGWRGRHLRPYRATARPGGRSAGPAGHPRSPGRTPPGARQQAFRDRARAGGALRPAARGPWSGRDYAKCWAADTHIGKPPPSRV